MSYLENLRKSKDQATVAYQEFALLSKKGGLFCFFEGKDNAYYVPRIKRYTENYHPIKCGGRDKVLEVHKLIAAHKEYDKYNKAFFIDIDFNKPLQSCNPPIFETPCYSIENFYVSIDVFREILKNELQLSENSPMYELSIDIFAKRQSEYHSAVTLLNAWYASLIEIRNATGKHTGVNLEDKVPKGYINFSLESVIENYNIDTIRKDFPNALEVTDKRLKEVIHKFSKCDCSKVFRGKYEMQFLITIIELILQDSSRHKKYSHTRA